MKPLKPPQRVVSLERALSKLGIASRTESRALILAGRVRVGGVVVRSPSRRVDPAHDRIRVDDRAAHAAPVAWWMLHKPVGCVTTRRDPQGRKTVYDYLPPDLGFVAPVGRLDADSSGLLLFTNETQAAARLTDPTTHVPKVYVVTLAGALEPAARALLAGGVAIEGRATRPARVDVVSGEPPRLRITLTEGRNRQVRRMVDAVGGEVIALHRTHIGSLELGELPAGEARPLAAAEITALRREAGAPERRV